MKIKTQDLTGPALDWAVAKAEGKTIKRFGTRLYYIQHEDGVFRDAIGGNYTPSTDWSQGGPIIERERINVCGIYNDPTRWGAVQADGRCMRNAHGPTPLIAAMRCFVASRLGDEVDVPDELLA